MDTYIENKTFDEIKIGDSASLEHLLTNKDIQLFALVSGDVNPAHVDRDYAESSIFQRIIAHGMWTGSLFSTILGTILPGPGTIYLSQTFKFLKPVGIGDKITATVTVTEKNEKKKIVTLECVGINQTKGIVIKGIAEVIAPERKVRRKKITLPDLKLELENCPHHHSVIRRTKGHEPLLTAVVHPVDKLSLGGAVESAKAGLITPILIGPEEKIKAVADEEGFDISFFTLVPTLHSHSAAEIAAQMAKEGKVEAIMKGKIHTDELMSPIIEKENGLRTERRMSHVAALDIPHFPRHIYVTDAALNIQPHLAEKKDIVQNVIDLFHAASPGYPRVAILSAIETVNEKIPSTLDATALCKMAERGQIHGGVLDGPLALDNALSEEAAKVKGIISPVAGKADILILPDIESANILMKQLTLFSKANMAGIVMGAKIPIILTSRSSEILSRKASCALALLYARRNGKITDE